MNFIKIKQVVAYDELMRQFYQDLDDFEMQKLVRTLDKMGYIQLMYRGETPMQITYIGRPTEIN